MLKELPHHYLQATIQWPTRIKRSFHLQHHQTNMYNTNNTFRQARTSRPTVLLTLCPDSSSSTPHNNRNTSSRPYQPHSINNSPSPLPRLYPNISLGSRILSNNSISHTVYQAAMSHHPLRQVHPVELARHNTHLELASMRVVQAGMGRLDNGNSSSLEEIPGQASARGNDVLCYVH